MSELSRREIQCLRLAGQDLGNKEIAARLGIAPSTVENHLSSAYAKLGTSDRRAAATIVARDYPDVSRFAPTPMAVPVAAPLAGVAPGDDPIDGREVDASVAWFLPAPPRRWFWSLGIILVFAAVGGVITAGLVQLAASGVEALAGAAPPDAIQALDSTQPVEQTHDPNPNRRSHRPQDQGQ